MFVSVTVTRPDLLRRRIAALALAVAHLLVNWGRVDRAFIERHVLGYAESSPSTCAATHRNGPRR